MDIFYGVPLKDITYGSQDQCVKVLQALLNGAKCDCGSCDGIYGNKTRSALHKFEDQHQLPVSDLVNMKTWNKLFNF